MRKPFYLSKRGAIWYAQFRGENGEIGTAKSSGLRNKTAAEAWARTEYERIEAEFGRSTLSLGEWARRFYIDGCPHMTRLAEEGKKYSRSSRSLGRRYALRITESPQASIRLCDLARRNVMALRSWISTQYGKTTSATGCYQTARAIIREAVYLDMIANDPTAGVKPPQAISKPRRVLSLDELRVVLNPALYRTEILFQAVLCAATTGMRQGEVRALRWADVDRDRGFILVHASLSGSTIILQGTKSGKPRITAYPTVLAAALEPRRGPPDAWVFPGPHGPMRYKPFLVGWRAACRDVGIAGATLHSLRHSLNTALLDAGIPADRLRGSFGWSGPAIQDRYTHRQLYDLGPQRDAVDKLLGGKS